MSRADRLRAPLVGLARWSSTTRGLAVLFGAGLVLRLLLAPGGGFPFDISTFASWADRLATTGPGAFYDDPDYFVDYPPGYLYVLWILGAFSRLVSSAPPGAFLLKLPAIAADLGLAWFAVVLTRRLTPPGLTRRFPWDGIAASAILFNPAVIYVSAVWGQVDAVHAMLVLAAFVLIGTGEQTSRREAGGLVLLMLALLTKPQSAFVIPAAVLVLVWRHVRGAIAEGGRVREAAFALARVGGLGIVALGAGMLLVVPFGLDPLEWVAFYRRAAATYPYTSVWAFNLWGSLAFWRPDRAGDATLTLFGVPAFWIGMALFVILFVIVAWRAWRALQAGEHEGRVMVFGAAAFTVAAFAALTRMHERYLFMALACLVPLIAYPWIRRVFVALSGLYLLNVYFAFAYYIDYVGRETFRIDALYRLIYGIAQDSTQKKMLSLLTGLLSAFIAVAGWRWLRHRHPEADRRPDDGAAGIGDERREGPPTPETTASGAVQAGVDRGVVPVPAGVGAMSADPDVEGEAPDRMGLDDVPPPPKMTGEAARAARRWTLQLHAVGIRGGAAALAVVILVAVMRLIGLDTPNGMYFDEVYHARTGGEYLQGKEVYEWTHPPLAKEIMAVAIATQSSFGRSGGDQLPGVVGGAVAAPAGDVPRAVWAGEAAPGTGLVRFGDLTGSCGVEIDGGPIGVGVAPTAVAAAGSSAVVGGDGLTGPAVVRLDGGEQLWATRVPAVPTQVATVGDATFAVTETGSLFRFDDPGVASLLAEGAAGLAAAEEDGEVWVSFPGQRKVIAYGEDGTIKADVGMQGEPGIVVAIPNADRVLATDRTSQRIESIDSESDTRTDELTGRAPGAYATVPETGLVWAQSGKRLELLEPRGLTVLGSVQMQDEPSAMIGLRDRVGVAALTDDRIECAAGRPQFGWRVGSAIFGALMAGAVLLLAVRLFGSLLAGALAAGFLAVDGLAFVMSRLAMNDSYVTAFVLLAWFSVLSAIYHWGARADGGPRSRSGAVVWLAATGLFAGLGAASKWVGVYTLAGIGVVLLYDVWTRGRDGVLSIFGPPLASIAALGVLVGVIPVAVYVASYVPYFQLGHGAADLIRLQRGMYDYHSQLTAGHPYGSPWYGWPIGRRAVWLYLGQDGARRAEIWTVGNPIVFLGGLVGMVALAYQAWKRRAVALVLPIFGALTQYLPWVAVSRVTFLYHYLPVVPFLAISLGWWVGVGRKGVPRGQRIAEVAAVAGAAVLAFALLLPVLDGWLVSEEYLKSVKTFLGWMFAVET